MAKQVTIKEIAERAGLSNPTVSRILNNKPGFSIKKENRELVLRLAREMGYQPNMMARSLRGGKRNCIGVVGTANLWEIGDPVTSRMYAGIGRVVQREKNFMTIIPQKAEHPDEAHERLMRVARSNIVDGLVIFVYSKFVETFGNYTIPILDETGIPYVALHFTARYLDCPNVGLNRLKGVEMAVQHLVKKRYSDIALVCSSTQPYINEYIFGYRQAMEAAGLGAGIRPIIEMDADKKAGRGLAQRLKDNRELAKAYVFQSDITAEGFMHCLADLGVKVPSEVGIVSCDNATAHALADPQITSLDCKEDAMAQAAAEMLYDIIENGKEAREGAGPVIFEPRLIVRGSSGQRLKVSF